MVAIVTSIHMTVRLISIVSPKLRYYIMVVFDMGDFSQLSWFVCQSAFLSQKNFNFIDEISKLIAM
jgi:hypothetical protein